MCSYYSTKACMPSEQETLPSKKVTPSKFDQVYSAINQSYAKIYTTLNEKFSPKKNEDNIKDEENLDTSDCSDDLIPQYDLKDLEIGPYYLQREADQLRSQLSVKEAKHLSKWENKWDQIMSLGSGRPLEEELDESGLYSEEDMSLRQYARLHSKSFPKLLEFGAPMQYRWNVWKYMLKPHRFFEDGLYEKLKGHISASESQIKKDLHRTFPEEKYFTSSKYGRIGQEQLHNVLRAIAAYFPNTGYVQGMNFLAGLMLLLSGGNELQSFWMFVALARDPKFLFMGLFEREFPLLNFYIFTFHGVLEAKLPNLYHHIQKHQLPIDMWLMKWFLTIFVPTLPSKDVVRIWDFILRQGFLGMIKIAVGIMKFYEKELLRQDACGMNMMFQSIMEDHLQKEYQESNILNTINPIINMLFGRNKEKNSSPGVRSNSMRCSFREFEVEEVLDHASEISLELEHMKEIIAIYEVETGNRLPEPYRKIMASLANPHNSSRRFKEFQNDLDYYMMRSGLHEAGNQGFKFDSFLGQNEANGERTA